MTWKPHKMVNKSGFIYLIEASNGRVKIGISAKPKDREDYYRTHSPIPVRLIAFWRGDSDEERALLKKFAAAKVWREWLRSLDDRAVWTFVEARRGTSLIEVLSWKEIDLGGKPKAGGRPRLIETAAVSSCAANP